METIERISVMTFPDSSAEFVVTAGQMEQRQNSFVDLVSVNFPNGRAPQCRSRRSVLDVFQMRWFACWLRQRQRIGGRDERLLQIKIVEEKRITNLSVRFFEQALVVGRLPVGFGLVGNLLSNLADVELISTRSCGCVAEMCSRISSVSFRYWSLVSSGVVRSFLSV